MNRVEITKEDLEVLPIGSLICFETYDSDDNTDWEFKYCKSKKGFIYLGGGIDFGTAIGKIDPIGEIVDYINNSDFPSFYLCEFLKTQSKEHRP